MSDPTPQPPYGASPYAPPSTGASASGAPASGAPASGAPAHGVPAQTYGQQGPYGQSSPYGQQAPYGQPSPYGQQAPYPPHPYGQPGVPSPQPGGPYAPAMPTRSPLPGRIGLGLVLAGAIVATVAAWIIGVGYGHLFVDLVAAGHIKPGGATLDSQTLQRDPLFQQFVATNSVPITVMSMASWLGFAGWITSIVAVARRAGRKPGVWGIVLGVLAPVAMMAAMVLAALPAIQSLI